MLGAERPFYPGVTPKCPRRYPDFSTGLRRTFLRVTPPPTPGAAALWFADVLPGTSPEDWDPLPIACPISLCTALLGHSYLPCYHTRFSCQGTFLFRAHAKSRRSLG